MRRLLIHSVSIFFILVICWSCAPEIDSQNPRKAKPKENAVIKQEVAKTTVKVFMENTGSMFGYYSRGNSFESSVAALITNVQVSKFADTVELNYINSKVFPSEANSTHDFLLNMNMSSVCAQKGDLSVTSVAALLDTVLSKTGKNDMSIFVSDCVISPGDETNAVNVLNAEENYIAQTFANALLKRNLAVVIYRLSSDFKGNYYDSNNVAHYQNGGSRPYFIWLIGNKSVIQRYKKMVPYKNIAQEMNIKNTCEFYKVKNNPKYKILGGDGNYKVSRNGKYVTDAKLGSQNKSFSVNIYVDYKELLSDNSYLCNSEYYTVSNKKYTVNVVNKAKMNYSHIIKLKTTRRPLSASVITINLRNELPQWVKQCSTYECDSVVSQTDKTFGFYSIVKGMQKAYNFKCLPYATIKVGINTNI